MLTRNVLKLAAVVLLLVLLATSACLVNAGEEGSGLPEVDPAPLIKLLKDALTAIMDEDYAKARRICWEAKATSLPSELGYLHTRVYGKLLELTSILEGVGKVCENAEPRSPKVKVVLYKLCEIKLELEDDLAQYVSRLSKYFRDDATRYVMVKSIEEVVASFMSKLNSDINKLIEAYLQGSAGGDVLKVALELPREVLGGSTLDITAAVTSECMSGLANLTVFVTYAGAVTEVVSKTVEIGSTVKVSIRSPSAEDLIRAGVKLDEELPIKVVALATALRGGEEVAGYAAANSTLVLMHPKLTVVVPNYIYPNQSINVTVLARISAVLRARIYLDKVDDSHLIMEADLRSGENTFSLNPRNLSVGYHKLYVVTEPSGAYLGFTHSSAFAVVNLPLVAVAEVPEVAVAPPFTVVLHVYVDTPVPYEVSVLVGGREVLRSTYTNKSRVTLTVPLPPTPFMWRYDVEVRVRALSPTYGSTTKLLTTYVVNLPVLAVAVATLGLAMVTPASSRYINLPLRPVLSRFRSQGVGSLRSTLQVPEEVAVARFRRPKLLKLYRRFTSLISKYVSPPKRSETLREFFRRLKAGASAWVQQLAWQFIRIYELDIYSRRDVDVRKASEVIRMLEEASSE